MNVSILGDVTSSQFLGFLLLEIFEHKKLLCNFYPWKQ